MTKCTQQQERRGHRRYILDLPLDYRTPGSTDPYGGIAINGSERGLLIFSQQDLAVGTSLSLWVLFADEFELTHIEAVAKVVHKVASGNRGRGYGYGLRLTRISEESLRKLRRLLRGCALVDVEGVAPSVQKFNLMWTSKHRPLQKGTASFLDFLKLNIR